MNREAEAVEEVPGVEENVDAGAAEENVDAGAAEENVDAGAAEENADAGAAEENVDAGAAEENADAGAEEENVDSGAAEENVDAGAAEELSRIINEDIMEEVINEDLMEEVINEDLMEEVINEDIMEEVINEDLMEDVINKEVQDAIAEIEDEIAAFVNGIIQIVDDVRQNIVDEVRQNIVGEVRQNIVGEVRQNIVGEVRQNIVGEVRQNIVGEIPNEDTVDEADLDISEVATEFVDASVHSGCSDAMTQVENASERNSRGSLVGPEEAQSSAWLSDLPRHPLQNELDSHRMFLAESTTSEDNDSDYSWISSTSSDVTENTRSDGDLEALLHTTAPEELQNSDALQLCQEQLRVAVMTIDELRSEVQSLNSRCERYDLEEERRLMEFRIQHDIQRTVYHNNIMELKRQIASIKIPLRNSELHILDLTATATRDRVDLKILKAETYMKDLVQIISRRDEAFSLLNIRDNFVAMSNYVIDCMMIKINLEGTYQRLRNLHLQGAAIDLAEMEIRLPHFPQPCVEIAIYNARELQANTGYDEQLNTENDAPPPYNELDGPPPSYSEFEASYINRSRGSQVPTGSDNQAHSNDNQIHSNDNQIHLNDNQIHSNDNQVHSNDNQIPSNDNQIHLNDNQIHSNDNQIHSNDNQIHTNENHTISASGYEITSASECQIPSAWGHPTSHTSTSRDSDQTTHDSDCLANFNITRPVHPSISYSDDHTSLSQAFRDNSASDYSLDGVFNSSNETETASESEQLHDLFECEPFGDEQQFFFDGEAHVSRAGENQDNPHTGPVVSPCIISNALSNAEHLSISISDSYSRPISEPSSLSVFAPPFYPRSAGLPLSTNTPGIPSSLKPENAPGCDSPVDVESLSPDINVPQTTVSYARLSDRSNSQEMSAQPLQAARNLNARAQTQQAGRHMSMISTQGRSYTGPNLQLSQPRLTFIPVLHTTVPTCACPACLRVVYNNAPGRIVYGAVRRQLWATPNPSGPPSGFEPNNQRSL